MGNLRQLAVAIFAGLSFAEPAQAAGVVALPDPSGITLFVLGVAGLLIGRHAAGKNRD